MKKKIALITGASGGIGGACAETLARAGYTVLLHGCHGLEHAKALADRLCAEGCDAHAVCCDLADSEARRPCAATFSPCIIAWTRWCCARAFRIPGFSAT